MEWNPIQLFTYLVGSEPVPDNPSTSAGPPLPGDLVSNVGSIPHGHEAVIELALARGNPRMERRVGFHLRVGPPGTGSQTVGHD